MFKEGLKNLTVTELSEETGISKLKLHDYINYGTPEGYRYKRDRDTGAGQPPYLLSEEDIELLAIIHELSQVHDLEEVKEMLKETDFSSEEEVIVEEHDLVELTNTNNVVPQVVAEFADEYKENKKPIGEVLLNPDTEKEQNLVKYLFSNEGGTEEQVKRQDLLFDVLANGYDKVEETLHKVIFEDNDCGFFLYKADDVSVTISDDLDNYEEYENEGRLLLTEAEILEYDARFIMFAYPQF